MLERFDKSDERYWHQRRWYDPKAAARIWCECPHILRTKEIEELFQIKKSTAGKIKNKIRGIMSLRNIMTYDRGSVDKRCTFDYAEIDIAEAEKLYKKLEAQKKRELAAEPQLRVIKGA